MVGLDDAGPPLLHGRSVELFDVAAYIFGKRFPLLAPKHLVRGALAQLQPRGVHAADGPVAVDQGKAFGHRVEDVL